jgi:hypothetical protein
VTGQNKGKHNTQREKETTCRRLPHRVVVVIMIMMMMIITIQQSRIWVIW